MITDSFDRKYQENQMKHVCNKQIEIVQQHKQKFSTKFQAENPTPIPTFSL